MTQKISKVGKILFVTLLAAIVAAAIFAMIATFCNAQTQIANDAEYVQEAQTGCILGASVGAGGISPVLSTVVLPKYAVIVCAVLGALIVVAAAALIVLAIAKKKSKQSATPAPSQDQTAEEPQQSYQTLTSDNDIADEAPADDVAEEQDDLAEQTPSEQPQADEDVAPTDEEPQSADNAAPAEKVEHAAILPAEDEEPEAEDIAVDQLSGFEETGDASGRAYDARRHVFVLVRYDRSYASRLIQSDDKTKSYYDEIKSELMSYKGVKSRVSWRHENFRIGRERVAKLQFRGKKLCLYLPLDPNDYIDSKYKIEDFSDVVKNKEVPLAYLIKNDLRARYAKELIAVVMSRFDAEKTEGETVAYSADYPFDTLDNLISRKLIKVLLTQQEYEQAAADLEAEQPADNTEAEPLKPTEVMKEVQVETAKKLLSDERASHLIEERGRYADRTRTGYVNVDVLSSNFEAGEFVTLDEMKKRVKGFDKRMTYVKVLARGVLDKPLIVEGDDFSIDAAKMILLTGGKVIRTKRM